MMEIDCFGLEVAMNYWWLRGVILYLKRFVDMVKCLNYSIFETAEMSLSDFELSSLK